jgi:carbon-monoxide dehydrogenase medium subunit
MIPVGFDYVRPESVDAAVALLTRRGEEATVLAGGHSLLPLMKLRFAAPELLVDIGRLRELQYVRLDGDEIAIGAGTRHATVEGSELLDAECPLLPAVARTVGDPQVRHRGTIGGALAHADPASDLPAAVLALGGTVVLRGLRGERRVPSTGFHTGVFSSVKEPDELLVEVRVPRTGAAGWAYEKFTRRANDWRSSESRWSTAESGWSTWARRRSVRPRPRPPLPVAPPSRRRPRWRTGAPTRPPTLPGPRSTGVTSLAC